MKLWLNQHVLTLKQVSTRLRLYWLNTVMICTVIGLTVTLPGLMFVGIHHLQQSASPLKQNAQISVFLKTGLAANTLQRLINDSQQLPQVAEVRYVSKEEALTALSEQLSSQGLMSDLSSNPLPDALYITMQDTDPVTIKPLQEALQDRPEVDELVIDNPWLQQLHDTLILIKRLAVIFTSLLGMAMVTVISNTVRMQVLTQQAEIEVSRLIGATQSYIRRPFLYLGSAYGFGGGLIAFACIGIVMLFVKQPLQLMLSHFPSQANAPLHWLGVGGLVIVLSTCIGWIAAFIALVQPRQ